MNKWKISAIFLIAASLFWFFLGFFIFIYCLTTGVDFFLVWILFFMSPCSLVWYVSYRCFKKSRGITTPSSPPAEKSSVSSPPPTPIFEHIDIDVGGCSKCGEDIGEDYRFCQSCGQIISQDEKLAAKYEIKAQEIKGKIYYYQRHMMRGIFVSSLGAFWLLVFFFTPVATFPGAFYSFVICLLGVIYFFPSFLYSGLRVILLKRTLNKNFTSVEVE